MKILLLSVLVSYICISGAKSQDEVVKDTINQSYGTDSSFNFLLERLENTDVSFLWSGNTSQENRLGYIGEDFQRLRIRFLSIIKNQDNPYEYFLYGKTCVKGNICEFQGSLLITETGYVEEENDSPLKRAFLSGDYVLFEDQSCLLSGVFRGNFFSSILIDKEGEIFYNDLELDDDGFSNNEFYGEWEDYFTDSYKPANWGDFRIPYSAGLDVGDEEFRPSFKYLENGWSEYPGEKKATEDGSIYNENWWER